MFFSEQLLLHHGPLAQVWLASTMEKKVSKNEYLGLDITTSVAAISNPTTGPKALRLSGQLLLGVTTVYQKKAQYLYDDCSEFILRLRTNKPGNVDASNATVTGREQALTMQNQVAEAADIVPDLPPELDDVAPPPLMLDDDMSMDLDEAGDDMVAPSQEAGAIWNGGKQGDNDVQIHEDTSIELGRGSGNAAAQEQPFMGDEEDLGLDLGDNDESIELGREAEPRPEYDAIEDDGGLMLEDKGGPDLDDFEPPLDMGSPIDPVTPGDANELEDSVQLANLSDGMGEFEQNQQQQDQQQTRKRKEAARSGPKKRITQFDEETTMEPVAGDSMTASQQVEEDQQVSRIVAHESYGISLLKEAYASPETYMNLIYQPPVGMPTGVTALLNPTAVRNAIRQQQVTSYEQEDEVEALERSPKAQRLENDQQPEGEHGYDDDGGLLLENNERDDEGALGMGGGDDFFDEEPQSHLFGPTSTEVQQENGASDSTTANRDISQNTLKAAEILRNKMPTSDDSTSFNNLVTDANRSDKVKMFFELLVLTTKDAISVNQPTDYGDIAIGSKEKLYNPIFSV
jgi:cohesin complex subunit SCC1